MDDPAPSISYGSRLDSSAADKQNHSQQKYALSLQAHF
jgi:hypothetical protein